MMLDPSLTLTAQFFLALLLLVAGLHKHADLNRIMAAVSAYRVVPGYFTKPVAWLVIAIELTVGTALVIPRTRESASFAAAGVFVVYFVVMSLGLIRGHREIDCGCSLYGREVPLSGAHLIRNGVLVLVAIMASMSDLPRAVGWVDGVQITAAVFCLGMIYLSADSLLANGANVESLEA